MRREDGIMELTAANVLRRGHLERQRDEVKAQADRVQQETGTTSCQPPMEGFSHGSSNTLSKWYTSSCPLIATRIQQHSSSSTDSSEGLEPLTTSSAAAPAIISLSRYGEPAPPNSFLSPMPWSHRMPDTLSHSASTAVPSNTLNPRDSHLTTLGPDASSSPQPPLADHQANDSHPHQPCFPAEEPTPEIQSGRNAHPKRFLFCIPWVHSQRLRSQILTCFISGVFLACLLAVYLGLALTEHISRGEVTIIIVLFIFSATVFFCYSTIRLCVLVTRGHHFRREQMPDMSGSRGYAVPPKPIPVVLTRDEEAAGIESETAKSQPPAYGLWRESMRADPNRLFWQRNESVAPEAPNPPADVRRPPSYISDDGISYVVEARPRSMAPPPNSSTYLSNSTSDGSLSAISRS
ncbi:hypothetical protein E4U57_006042 [Claviceps arundinis]|uniref:Uncharacterized protein n=1 Tax=Claviceps arundinis TaxID=1623583 RepID=A0ABQ7PMQ3_9HYPO|nr:hypothetical protein E4U57_006042 [Claviceps arundinis]